MRNQNNRLDTLIEVLVLFRLAVTIMPVVGLYSNSLINIGTFVLLYACLIIGLGGEKAYSIIVSCVPIFLISILYLFSSIIEGESFFGSLYELFMNLQWPLVCVYIIRSQKWKMTKRILIYVLSFYVITSFTTYIGSNMFEGAARHMSNGHFAEENPDLMNLYYSYNIGTFTFIYSLVILFPLLLYLLRNTNKGGRWLSILSIIFVFTVIIKTEYTTAILLLLSCFVLLLLPKTFSKNKLFSILLLSVIVVLVSAPLLSGLMELIASMAGSEQVEERLSAVSVFRSSKIIDDSNDFGQRMLLWQESLDVFSSNIMFGSSGRNGGHSFVFDNMARFGIIGLVSIFIVFSRMYKQSFKSYKSYAVYGYCLYAFIINIAQCILNPVINYIAFTFIIPLFCFYFSRIEDERNSKTVLYSA